MKLAEYVAWLRRGPGMPDEVGSVPPSVFYLDEGKDYFVSWEVQNIEEKEPQFVVGVHRIEMGAMGEYGPRPIALQFLPAAYHMRALYTITALYHWATQALPFPAALMSGSVAHLMFRTRKTDVSQGDVSGTTRGRSREHLLEEDKDDE